MKEMNHHFECIVFKDATNCIFGGVTCDWDFYSRGIIFSGWEPTQDES